ncbi:MAG: HD domain-containing protein, partial [Thermodesulfobacteriota bacterium]
RKEKYSDASYFTEPDIKEGPGGLRDLHMMSWMARIYFKSDRLYRIRRFPVFSHFRLEQLGYSKWFLIKVRNRLHLMSERKEDRLLIPFQQEISRDLGYKDGPLMTGPEKFMRDIYRHLNRIRYGRAEFLAKALDLIDPRPFESIADPLPPEFRVTKGNIVLAAEGRLKENPLLILRGFEEANRRGLFLGSGFIWEAGKILSANGKGLLDQPGSWEMFLRFILKPVNPEIFRIALEIDLLTLFIPEFKRIRNLVQFGFYHMATVDLHSLKTLEVLNRIGEGGYDDRWPLFKEIFKELQHPEWLFLAGLLHDIGKGYPGDHSVKGAALAPRILKRLGVKEEAMDKVPLLIRDHLLLIHASQKRDLNDEKTSVQIAQIIK